MKHTAEQEIRRHVISTLTLVLSGINHGQNTTELFNANAAQKVAEFAVRFLGQNEVSAEDASEFAQALDAVGRLPENHKRLFADLTGWEYPQVGFRVQVPAMA